MLPGSVPLSRTSRTQSTQRNPTSSMPLTFNHHLKGSNWRRLRQVSRNVNTRKHLRDCVCMLTKQNKKAPATTDDDESDEFSHLFSWWWICLCLFLFSPLQNPAVKIVAVWSSAGANLRLFCCRRWLSYAVKQALKYSSRKVHRSFLVYSFTHSRIISIMRPKRGAPTRNSNSCWTTQLVFIYKHHQFLHNKHA